MATKSRADQMPLPFTTAALGLFVSYLYPTVIGPIIGTLLGFALGVTLLFLGGTRGSSTPPPTRKQSQHNTTYVRGGSKTPIQFRGGSVERRKE